MKVGQKFALRAISGDFTPFVQAENPRAPLAFSLRPLLNGKTLILIGAGTGATPLMSMLRALCALRYQNRVLVHFSARTVSDLIFARELAQTVMDFASTVQLCFSFTRAGSEKEESTHSIPGKHSAGRLSARDMEELIRTASLDLANTAFFLW